MCPTYVCSCIMLSRRRRRIIDIDVLSVSYFLSTINFHVSLTPSMFALMTILLELEAHRDGYSGTMKLLV